MQLAQKAGSDRRYAEFVVASQSAINAYASAMGRGSPVTTVHAQQEAQHLLSTATSHEAYSAALGQMQKEMEAARKAPVQVRQDIRNQITGQQGQPAPQPPQGVGFTARTATNKATAQRMPDVAPNHRQP